METSEWIAVGSAALAFASLVANWTIVRRQLVILAEQVGTTLDGEKARWLADVLGTYGDATALVQSRVGVYTPHEFTRRRLELANRFSALADQGRLYFPNIGAEAYGQGKHFAFRGKRRPILDALILAHDVVSCLDQSGDVPNAPLVELLFGMRRVVVSEVQYSIDPQRRDALLGQARRMNRDDSIVSREDVQTLVARACELPNIKLSFTRDDLPPAAQDKAR